MSPQIIYCTKNDKCDNKCGRFHKLISSGINRTTKPLSERKNNKLQSLDIPTTSNDMNNNDTSPRLSVTNSIEPISPFSCASTVTLDDIIASARRKVSADFQPILLPSPIFLDEDPASENSNNYYKSRRRRESEDDNSLNDVDEIEDEFIKDLIDSDEDDYWFSGDPPSLIIDEDLADFDELLK